MSKFQIGIECQKLVARVERLEAFAGKQQAISVEYITLKRHTSSEPVVPAAMGASVMFKLTCLATEDDSTDHVRWVEEWWYGGAGERVYFGTSSSDLVMTVGTVVGGSGLGNVLPYGDITLKFWEIDDFSPDDYLGGVHIPSRIEVGSYYADLNRTKGHYRLDIEIT